MDHDLLVDLRHLDDPEPPGFGAPGAEEATRRAAVGHIHRARVVAGLVLAVAALTAAGLIGLGQERPGTTIAAAPPSTPAPASTSEPTDGVGVGAGSTTLAPAQSGPATVTPAPTSSVAPPPTTAPPRPTTSAPRPTTAPTSAPVGQVAGAPPRGSVPAPAGLRFTLSLEGTQVTVGSSVRGKVRFENSRSTPVTVSGSGCGEKAHWKPNLYVAGRFAPGTGPDCMMLLSETVPAGAVSETEVELYASADTPPGRYDAFSVVTVEEDRVGVHSSQVGVSVVRP